jgi:VWFA-related protein
MTARCLSVWISILAFCLTFPFAPAHAQRNGGGRGVRNPVNPATNAKNAAVFGTGDTSTIVHLSSADNESRVEFRSQTVLIQVPVVVTDKSGNHLHGLTKEDFHVFENGKEQPVSTFEELVATSDKLAIQPAAPGQFRNLTLESRQPRNVVVIAIDTVNTPFMDQAYGRREVIKYLANNLNSGQVMALMLITSRGLRVVQGLTDDPTRLIEALRKASGELPAMEGLSADAQADAATGSMSPTMFASSIDPSQAIDSFVEYGDAVEAEFQQQNAIETTMNAFLGIAWSLAGVPGRKSLIWATGSFPFAIDSPASVPGGSLSLLYERTMLALNEAEVSVYPVDVRGLVNASPIVEGNRRTVATGSALSRQVVSRSWLQMSTIDTLHDFADMTGGKAFYNTNDVAGSVKRAADDASSYYLVGYYLDTHNTKPGWRRLQVKTARKDTEVRARNGFFVTNATMNPLISRNFDMSNALNSPIEGTGVPVTVQWLTVSGDADKKKAVFMAQMPANSLSFDSAGRDQLNFDFAAVAFNDKDRKVAASSTQIFNKPIPEQSIAAVRANGVRFRNALELSPGKYTVRFVVRDNVTGKVGSVTAPLTVN